MSELLPILIAYSVIVTLWAVSERIGRKGLERLISTSYAEYLAKRGQL